MRDREELFKIIDESVRSGARKAIAENNLRQLKSKQDIMDYAEEILRDIEKVSSANNIDISIVRPEVFSLLEKAINKLKGFY